MIIKVNEKTSLELYKEIFCGSKPQCSFCDKNYIKTKVEQSHNKINGDCLTFFCCKKNK